MSTTDRRLSPPRLIHEIRVIRVADTAHNLRARQQVLALLALVSRPGGDRK